MLFKKVFNLRKPPHTLIIVVFILMLQKGRMINVLCINKNNEPCNQFFIILYICHKAFVQILSKSIFEAFGKS